MLTKIKNLVQSDLNKSIQLINSSCDSSIPLLQEIASYLIQQEGKMIRPLTTIICSYLCNYQGQEYLDISAAIELIHAATLLHDDIIDNAHLRRGKISAHYKWGNEAAVLVGDFLLAKALTIIANINNPEILKTVGVTTCTIAEGEILQLANRNNIHITEQTYLEIITKKTAKLFATAAIAPAILANCSLAISNNIAEYGLHLGIAFQLINDLFDYQPTKTTPDISLPIYEDLQQGNLTLPIIHLLENGSKAEQTLIQDIVITKKLTLLPQLQKAIANSNAIPYTIELIKNEALLAKKALSDIVNSNYKVAALELIDVVVSNVENTGCSSAW